MSELTPAKKTKPTIQAIRNSESLSERLRKRIRNFAIRDRQGELIGEVKDLIPDNKSDKNFRLVVSRPDTHQGIRFFLLDSKHLYKVDNQSRSLFTSLDKAAIDQLDEYDLSTAVNSRLGDPVLIPVTSMTRANDTSAIDEVQIDTSDSQANSTANTNQMSASVTDLSGEEEFNQSSQISSQTVDVNNSDALISEPTISEPTFTQQANTQHIIQLLEERLSVDRTKRKVGEIIVRKEIETRVVEVPVRREKLIVEQVGSEHKRLAEIDIGAGEVTGVELANLVSSANGGPVVQGTFNSLKTVSQLLDVITKTIHYQCKKVVIELMLSNKNNEKTLHQFDSLGAAVIVLDAIANNLNQVSREIHVELILEDEDAQPIYQKWFDYYSRF